MRMQSLGLLSVFLTLGVAPGATDYAECQEPQSVISSQADWKEASSDRRLQTLNSIVVGKTSMTPDALVELLRLGLDDSDPAVRAATADCVASRGYSARTSQAGAARWREERPVLLQLKGRLLQLITSDPKQEVRVSAIVAAGNLEFDGSGKGIKLSNELTDVLARQYRVDPATVVRSEIVKSLALCDSDSGALIDTLTLALSDPDAIVIQRALHGVSRHQMLESLPKVISLLETDDNPRVREAAANAVGDFGKAATAYLPRLTAAAASESDVAARSALMRAVDKIKVK